MLNSKRQLLHLIHNLSNGIIAGKPIPGAVRNKRENRKDKTEQELNGYSKFSDVFLISALNGDGISDIKVRIYLFIISFPQFPCISYTQFSNS